MRYLYKILIQLLFRDFPPQFIPFFYSNIQSFLSLPLWYKYKKFTAKILKFVYDNFKIYSTLFS